MKPYFVLPLILMISCHERDAGQQKLTNNVEAVWVENEPASVLMDADIDPFVSVENMSVDEVKVLLNTMYQADQQYRDSLYNGNPDRENFYWKKIYGNDQANKKLLNKILDQHGWPGIAQFGEARAEAAWYVAWHQRDSERSMDMYLNYMEEADRRHDMKHEQYLLVKNQLANLRSVGNAKN
jgi:hypothetical protein